MMGIQSFILLAGLFAVQLAGAISSADLAAGSLRADSEHNGHRAADDKVDDLPGWGKLTFGLYSGYVEVDAEAGRSLFYAFVEGDESEKSGLPLVLWLNGGPGCSSLSGFFRELGPFFPSLDGNGLVRNEYAWSQAANMIFLESPAFVGFSYSNTSSDATTDDSRTTADSLTFLLRWFERFPQYVGRPFWMAGESYSGHYIPLLADAIQRHNRRSPGGPINLRGFLIGNAWTDAATENKAAVDYWYGHAIISEHVHNGILRTCDFTSVDLKASPAFGGNASAGLTEQGSKLQRCEAFVQQATDEMGGIDLYDMYADVCIEDAGNDNPARQLARVLRDHPAGLSLRPLIAGELVRRQRSANADQETPDQPPNSDPCIGDLVAAYLNRPDVQRALHANTTGQCLGPWVSCTPNTCYSCDDVITSMLPVYQRLLGTGLKILVYSGDLDAVIPVVGTRRWVHGLRLRVLRRWRPWRSSTRQVGGWTVDFEEGITFSSVRGAGHMVPYTQPERAFHLFSSWVHEQPL